MDETELETWSDEGGFGGIVRRQIRVVSDAMGPSMTPSQAHELALRVQGLRSLLMPYTASEGRKAIDSIMSSYKERIAKTDGENRDILSYRRSIEVFQALLEIAKKAGFLKE